MFQDKLLLCREDSFLAKFFKRITDGPHPVKSLKTSPVKIDAINAFVLAIAGMIFFATPIVSISVTPSMLNFLALYKDFS